jgi:ATP-dependent Clp protease adaptor protein ClpS
MSESQDASRDSTGVAAQGRPQTVPRSRPKREPPYAVVIENDPDHTFEYVIDTLRRVFGYGWLKAVWLTTQVHVRGRASVWIGPLETAEFKRERILGMGPDFHAPRPVNFPLGVRLEPLVS